MQYLRTALIILAMAFSTLAAGQARNAPFTELTPPQPTEAAGKVEVIEFFWYGCPHCYAFEPLLVPWSKSLPKEVVLKRVPAIFNEQWGVAARVFYALEAIGEQERLHQAVFDAIHKENLRITDESAFTAWLGKQGVDVNKYKAAYRSFGVETKLKRAQQMTQAYRIDGVPALAVQGRYVLTATNIPDRQDLLKATNQLIANVMKQSGIRATGPLPGEAKAPAAKAAK
jgi:thiol:disulfide interchange protein DsbA